MQARCPVVQPELPSFQERVLLFVERNNHRVNLVLKFVNKFISYSQQVDADRKGRKIKHQWNESIRKIGPHNVLDLENLP